MACSICNSAFHSTSFLDNRAGIKEVVWFVCLLVSRRIVAHKIKSTCWFYFVTIYYGKQIDGGAIFNAELGKAACVHSIFRNNRSYRVSQPIFRCASAKENLGGLRLQNRVLSHTFSSLNSLVNFLALQISERPHRVERDLSKQTML
jgi:hypothetical protein